MQPMNQGTEEGVELSVELYDGWFMWCDCRHVDKQKRREGGQFIQ